MKQKVSLARALKEKNRVAGRLARILTEIGKENSKEELIPRGVDVAALFEQSKRLRRQLTAIKQSIALANQPIIAKILELDEIKSEIAFLNNLDVQEGRFITEGYRTTIEKHYSAIIRKAHVIEEVARLQARADALQDALDEFNVVTKVMIDIDERN